MSSLNLINLINLNNISYILISVCEFPSHIDAREIESKKDWITSTYILVHDISSENFQSEWRYGLSKNYG